ncbi:MFS-type transporter-like protein 51 [Elsinoe fawcettii]|nr:MFS-type transporter-like protein 51 [Elsinoe fawcettii]
MSALPEKTMSVEKEEHLGDPESLKQIQTVDTVHNDEALRVLEAYDGPATWSEEEENKIRRRIDLRLMPVLCATYGLQYYDKAMLSQAALFGIRQDLNLLTGNRYSMTASIFYFGFIVGAYGAMVLAQRFPVERVASCIVTIWGVCLILTTVCHNYQGIYAQRFFLGFLESGVSPLFMLMVGSFYKKDEQAFRMGVWYSLTGYVSCISPLINYGFGSIGGSASTWKYMYYFAGGITIAWGLLLYVIMLPDPVRAKGFNARERYIMIARLRSNNSGVRNKHFKWAQVRELLLDAKFWTVFWIATLSMIANGPISTFVPIIIRGFGFSSLNSLLLLIPIGFYAGSAQLTLTYLAYRFKGSRSYLIFGAQIVTTIAAILLWKLPLRSRGGLLFASIILPSIGAGYAVLMGQSVANTAGYTKRSIASSGLYVGYCLGNIIGPLVFLTTDAPRYPIGFIVVFITSLIAGALALFYRWLCVRTNNSRDAAGVPEAFDHAYEDDLTDKKKQSENGGQKCSPCKTADQNCEIRESRRGKRKTASSGSGPIASTTGTTCAPRASTASFQVAISETSRVTVPPIRASISRQSSGIATAVSTVDAGHTQAGALGVTANAQAVHSTSQAVTFTPQPAAQTTSTLPDTPISASIGEGVGQSHQDDVDTGYLQIFNQENQLEADIQDMQANFEYRPDSYDPQHLELSQTFAETYWDECYCWAPVLDMKSIGGEMTKSPLLANAVAIVGSHVKPPLVQHEGPAMYYDKARKIFYNDEESDTLTALKSLCLFYWWAPRSTATIHRHSSWWWTSVIIRHAQQMGIHREPAVGHPLRHRLDLSLRRRIWWTVFARERLTALCQSKPCIIDPIDCNISEPQLSDFPDDPVSQKKGLIFIHWVRLCGIIGGMAKTLFRTGDGAHLSRFEIYRSLVDWVQRLPAELSLQIGTSNTAQFDKHVHQLHLPYLTAIIILHLRREAQDLPQALPPAMLAASCIARILHDILLRGNARYLMPITCWYTGVAFIPLLQATRVPNLAKEAEYGISILFSAVEQLQKMWASANVIRLGFERMRKGTNSTQPGASSSQQDSTLGLRWRCQLQGPSSPLDSDGQYDWTALFPFATKQTGTIAAELLGDNELGTVTRGLASPANLNFYESMQDQYHNFFDTFTEFPLDFSDLDFQGAELQ